MHATTWNSNKLQTIIKNNIKEPRSWVVGEKARATNNKFAQKTPHIIVKKKLVNNPIHLK
jgi:hypothetical protein